jgi:formylmethanofuran dehydrogenase subunit E-like metal-binding protein
VGLCILLELSLRSKSWILDSIAIKMCSNTVGKWVGVGYGSDFWEAHCTTTFTEHPRWMGRLLRLDTTIPDCINLTIRT